ncbi:TIM barrel protein [Paracoccus sp. (in: a-proteobacteria)]|uniref:TIM barrel protein n=1 Tax=Paracoccus sp. TaxID=267 RepID=UPI00321FA65E
MRFLANTGFLFTDLAFPERLDAAAAAGFDGVEFHDELQRHDPPAIADRLARLGLAVGSLNMRMGETVGLAALPGHEAAFAADLAAAEAAAQAVGARAIHVLAGRGATDEATFLANLRRALAATDRLLLIEPICAQAIPGYHLSRLEHACELAERLGPRLRVMFDWYHAASELGEKAAAAALVGHRGLIGHVQAAALPGRNEPGIDIIARIRAAGFTAVGLEYRPLTDPAHHLAALRRTLAG